MAGDNSQTLDQPYYDDQAKRTEGGNFVVPDVQQTSYQGGSQKANQYVREAMRIKRQSCTATGGFNKGQGDNHECLYGEDAVAHIEGIGENAPGYERAQQWLSEYNEEPDLDDPYSVDGEDPFDDIGAYAVDTDGDGFVDTVVRDNYIEVAGENGIQTEIETVRVNGNEELDAEVQAAQDLKDSIYEQEGWDDLEPWEQDQQLINAGGSAINGTDGTEPEEEEEVDTSLSDKTKEAVDKVKAKFPTMEDLIAELPKDPTEWVDAIKTVLETAGINLPNGDVDAILQGGYGVKWDPANSVFKDVLSGEVFVPGIPAGGAPSSVTIGTLEDLLKYPKETIEKKVEEIWGQISGDPVDFIKGIIASGADLPPNFFDVLGGIVAAGAEFLEWAKNAAAEAGTEVPPVVGGEDDEEDKDTEDDLTFGGIPGDETVDPEYAKETPNLVIPTTTTTETTTNEGLLTGTNDNLTFGGESGNGITEKDINDLYLNLLGRNAKQSGLDYWMSDVERGATLEEIASNIVLSDEYKNLNANNGNVEEVVEEVVVDPKEETEVEPEEETEEVVTEVVVEPEEETEVEPEEETEEVVTEVVVEPEKETEEVVTEVVEETEEEPEIFTGVKVVPPVIVERPPPPEVFDEPTPEPEVLITEDPGGGGGGGGGGGANEGLFEDFLGGINYTPLQLQPLIQSKQRKSLVSSLFSEYFV